MGIEWTTGLLFLSLFVLILMGVPLAFALGTVALTASFFLWGPQSLYILGTHAEGLIFNYTLLAVPFFVFMANILNVTRLAEGFYDTMYKWLGPVRGGLGYGTVLACAVIAAMSGVSAVGVVTMGVLALPSMLRHGYNRKMAMGTIMAGGALGQLIPPSILALLYSGVAGISVGKMFLAGVGPGALLVGLYILYIAIRSGLNYRMAPPMSLEERATITWGNKFRSLIHVIPAAILIFCVLGLLLLGVASPSEAAATGAAGSVCLGLLAKRLNWEKFKEACLSTVQTTSMVMWIAMASVVFVSIYAGIGGDEFIRSTLEILTTNRWTTLILIFAVIFLLGTMMDPVGIIFLAVPIFLPIVESLGFDKLWFGGMVILCLETAYLTPPFGYNLFYLKSVTPPDVKMKEIYQAAIPFILIQLVALALCILFPQIVVELPNRLLP
jgi:tripartite ATP-independent transporter DctM subunit